MANTFEINFDPLNIIGISIDDYRVVDYMTTGGMAHIYKATDGETMVVIKLLREEMNREPDAKRRFHKEAYALKQLDHPHIIKLLHEGRYQHSLYMVFEYAALGSLQEYTEHDHAGFTLGDVAIIVEQIASALHTLHEQNFIHRDVKPGNIMMRGRHNTALADFGIVRTEDVNMRFGIQPGTLDFMAPEQIVGLDADFTTDQFALGVLTYWLLTGEKPFLADTREEAALQRRMGALSVYDISHKLPKEFDPILSRAMNFDMRERFTFIEEFAHLIVQVIEKHQLQDLPALGTMLPRANISHTTDSDSFYSTKKNRGRFNSIMEPYGWISISILGIMLLIIAITSAAPFGTVQPATPRAINMVVFDLQNATRDLSQFDCDAFITIYNEIALQVRLNTSNYARFAGITHEQSATRSVFLNYCTDESNRQFALNPDLWDAMQIELSYINPN